MSFTYLLDGLVAVLLVVTVGYCVILHRRLGALRDSQNDLEKLLGAFAEATESARRGVAELRAAGDQVGQELQARVDAARILRDELEMIADTGNDLADRLDQRLMERKEAVTEATSQRRAPPMSESERELMVALRQAR
ncbi:MAG: DUF6468 domain-containing protein [Alphaproteobacteria bacterium]